MPVPPYMVQQGVEIPTRIFVGNLPYEVSCDVLLRSIVQILFLLLCCFVYSLLCSD